MKKLSTLLILLSTTGLLLAAPSTPIARGRLTTDLDAAGHSITNGPMATTNFVWDVVGAVTNNLPSGGLTTNDVRAIVADVSLPLSGGVLSGSLSVLTGSGTASLRVGANSESALTVNQNGFYHGGTGYKYLVRLPEASGTVALESGIAAIDIRTNLPPLSATATVGDLVDALNAIANALRPKEEEEP